MSARCLPASRKRAHSPDLQPSAYVMFILRLSDQMTEKNVADAKCYFAFANKLSERELNDIKYASDLFRVLRFQSILQEEQSLEPLIQLMATIKRDDLRQQIVEYAATPLKVAYTQHTMIHAMRYRNMADDDSMSVTSGSSSSSRSSSSRMSVPPSTYSTGRRDPLRSTITLEDMAKGILRPISRIDERAGGNESDEDDAPSAPDVAPSPLRASRLQGLSPRLPPAPRARASSQPTPPPAHAPPLFSPPSAHTRPKAAGAHVINLC